MAEDAHKNRFLSKLLIFSVTMLILVLSNNFLTLFIGWEGVGLVSYLLINFWFNSINSNKFAIKAILFNKIGDIGLLFSIIIIINLIGNTNFITYINSDWVKSNDFFT